MKPWGEMRISKEAQGEKMAKDRAGRGGLNLGFQQVEKNPARDREETVRAAKEEALVLQNRK